MGRDAYGVIPGRVAARAEIHNAGRRAGRSWMDSRDPALCRPRSDRATMAGDCMPRHKLANGMARIDFATDPSRYRHWKLARRRRGRDPDDGRRREGRPVRGLRAQAQFLRSRRRHRARRRVRAHPVRASAGARGAVALRQAARVLRRRQHPHAGGREPCPQGQFLQVHQRDPQRHRGRERGVRPAHHLRHQRHGRGRRLRARARGRPHHPGG